MNAMSETSTTLTEIGTLLDRIERLVAAALDISVLLSLRGELIEILSAMPERQSLRPASKRGHAMRRLVENIIGEILILQKRLGLRHRGQGGPRKGARPPTLASFALPGPDGLHCGKHVRVPHLRDRSMFALSKRRTSLRSKFSPTNRPRWRATRSRTMRRARNRPRCTSGGTAPALFDDSRHCGLEQRKNGFQ